MGWQESLWDDEPEHERMHRRSVHEPRRQAGERAWRREAEDEARTELPTSSDSAPALRAAFKDVLARLDARDRRMRRLR